ncbi:Uncharacterized conserved protein [Phaffia rhodozyma]|uniref:Uncharacterized conserved protein n=1 Tax=Phaffia rhodozyma TaxID=264483 RepID=A0A0F7SNZ1_PHARH|nr:Uncharacterized conserved protein [Phaffia rhodozyma]
MDELIMVSSGNKYTQVSVKAVISQIALMSGISLATLVAFSFFRPRERKVYAPKVKYRSTDEDELPPPALDSGFFSWLKPLITKDDLDLVDTIGVDAVAFLQFLSLLRWFFLSVSILVCAVLLPINYMYSPSNLATISRLTISGLGTQTDNPRYNSYILFVHVGATYLITFLMLFFCWFYWKKMMSVRQAWFMSKKFQRSIQSRSLMIVNIKKEYQSDEGLKALIMQLRGGNEKLASNIQSAMIGRNLKEYPEMIEDYNDTVRDFEEVLVKYLKGGQEGKRRPTIKRGGFLGIGAEKVDAIEFYGNKLGRLREVLDAKREDIEILKPKYKKNKKPGTHPHQNQDGSNLTQKEIAKRARNIKIPAENYGFVSMMDAAQAHAIAKGHQGSQRSLRGAELTLAPAPGDILWHNANVTPGERFNSKIVGFALLSLVCFFNTVPLAIVAAAANLVTLAAYVPFLNKWQQAGTLGDWTFSIVAGVLPPTISAGFQLLLPYFIRKLTKYQGATSRSQVDRIVLTRYYAFLVISQFFVFSLLTVFVNLGIGIAKEVEEKKSFKDIWDSYISILPSEIQSTYVLQSTYWLTFFPLRGFLVFFELAQLIKLALLSIKTFLFARTPRDIQEWTRPPYFQYSIVYANLLFLCTVGLVYAPLAPLVVASATIVFWLSHYIYKYQLLYVYSSRTESGGRMWNVAINRLLVALMFMQALIILTISLQTKSWDAFAAAPPFIITVLFKVFVLRPYGNQFHYFVPTLEASHGLLEEARHSYKQRFIHPALKDDVLFTVTVHKEQQDLVQQILAPYSSKLQREVAGVRETDLTEYNATLDTEKQVELDEGGHTAEHDGNSTFRNSFVGRPNGLERSLTEDSAFGGTGYSQFATNDGSTVELIHSAAPMADAGGWYGRHQSLPNDEPDYENPYSHPSARHQPTGSTLATLPLLDRSDHTPALESPQEEYQMAEFNFHSHPDSNNYRGDHTPPPVRSPSGYGFVPTDNQDEDDVGESYHPPGYEINYR